MPANSMENVNSILHHIRRKVTSGNLREDKIAHIYFTIDRVEHIY